MSYIPAVDRIEVGVDYVTATCRAGSDNFGSFIRASHALLEQDAAGGSIYREGKLLGYTGHQSKHAFFGTSEQGLLLRVSGAAATDAFYQVGPFCDHISRLDLQATVQYSVEQVDVAQLNYLLCNAANERLPLPRRRKLTLWAGNDGGATLYIGSRTSEQFARIYNKYAQSDETHYERCWRFEVQFTNKMATHYAQLLLAQLYPRNEEIADMVHSWLIRRGVQPPWHAFDNQYAVPAISLELPDDQKRIDWIAKQVAPAVRQLIDSGYRDVLYSLLFGSEAG